MYELNEAPETPQALINERGLINSANATAYETINEITNAKERTEDKRRKKRMQKKVTKKEN